jgi:hypothetical protein
MTDGPTSTAPGESGSGLRFGVDAGLHAELATMPAGRTLVIDYFAGRRCGVVTGDLTVEVRDAAVEGPYVEVAPVDGLRIVVQERLRDVLERSGPTLRLVGPRFRRHIGIELDRPELWIDFLDQPGVLRGRLWG